jgi:hypothetical protein
MPNTKSKPTNNGGSIVEEVTQDPRDAQQDDPLTFFYKPHTITAMMVSGIIVVYFAFTREASATSSSNVKSYVHSIL